MSGFAGGKHPRVEEVYELGEQLGKGSFSTVYVGIDRKTREKVALKVISAKAYRGQERAKQLLRTEVAVMTKIKKLSHPNLMRFKHTFEDSEKIVMVLELLADELFTRIVQRGHYSERDASQLCKTIVAALDAMHSIGVLHRDLKPENCIFANQSADAPLKLTDFGLAAIVAPEGDRKLHDRHLVGTPGYIAPEVLTAYDYSPASDMWAAGVITFIMLSGSPPFYGRNHPEIFDRIRKARWGFNGRNWGQVSENAKDLVKRMLAQNPAERLTAAQIMEHPWIKEYDTQSDAHLADAIEDLKKFNARQKFKGAALACIAGARISRLLTARAPEQLEKVVDPGMFTSEELVLLQREFSIATKGSSNGALNFEAFSDVMAKLKLGHLPLDRIFQIFDQDGGGEVDYKEFLLGLSKFRLKGEDQIKFAFNIFDEDHSGAISRDELTKVLVHTRRRSRAEQSMPTAPPPAHHRRHSSTDSQPAILTAKSEEEAPSPVAQAMEEEGGMERFDARYMEMDPDAYEIAEGIAELFDSLDEDGDNQVTLDEFLNGVKRHPELLELFFKAENGAAGAGGAADMELSSGGSVGV